MDLTDMSIFTNFDDRKCECYKASITKNYRNYEKTTNPIIGCITDALFM